MEIIRECFLQYRDADEKDKLVVRRANFNLIEKALSNEGFVVRYDRNYCWAYVWNLTWSTYEEVVAVTMLTRKLHQYSLWHDRRRYRLQLEDDVFNDGGQRSRDLWIPSARRIIQEISGEQPYHDLDDPCHGNVSTDSGELEDSDIDIDDLGVRLENLAFPSSPSSERIGFLDSFYLD